jgi:hypothetical protein
MMRKIRTEMFAITYKGRIYKGTKGQYFLFSKKKDAQEFVVASGADVVKVTVTITPKE